MEKLFYKYPTTIGEELKYQVQYCQSIGRFKNNSDISLKMRELEREVFGKERKYSAKDETKKDNTTRNVRPATLTELFKISSNKKISNYFLLFIAFKSLDIIKEDYNIIKLLEYYNISPKKDIDIKRLDEILFESNKTFESKVNFCRKCVKNINQKCSYSSSCLFSKISKELLSKDIDEQLKLKFSLGLPSNFEKFVGQPILDYGIDLETLKIILKKYGENEKVDFIEDLEMEYFREREVSEMAYKKLKTDLRTGKEKKEEWNIEAIEFSRERKKNMLCDYTYHLLIKRITESCCYNLKLDKEEICTFAFGK